MCLPARSLALAEISHMDTNAVLSLWSTSPMLVDALELAKAWGSFDIIDDLGGDYKNIVCSQLKSFLLCIQYTTESYCRTTIESWMH